MIDTVKLLFPQGQFVLRNRDELRYSSTERGVKKYVRNPSASELKSGMYLPRMTLIYRPTRYGMREELTVEFSAPKVLKANNFDELRDEDFEAVVDKLQASLKYIGVNIFHRLIMRAKVVAWHPSKNIPFLDYFACQTVINTLRKVDASRVYSVRKTDFEDGEVLHFHCNSKDIAFYDKLADLRKGKVSDKKSIENHNRVQLNLLELLETMRPLSVLRYELRLNGVQAIRRAYPGIPKDELTFERLFNTKLSQSILIEHWQMLTRDVDYLALDVAKPLEILQNYLTEHTDTTPYAALAAVAGIFVANQTGVRNLRQTLDARFGPHVWARLKPHMQVPQAYRYKHILRVGEVLEQFQPTQISQLQSPKHN